MENQAEKAQIILQATCADSTDGTYTLNSDITNYLQDIANASLTLTKTKTKTKTNSYTNNQPWYTKENRDGIRNLRKAACIVSEFPDSEYLRKKILQGKASLQKPQQKQTRQLL